MIRLNNSFKLLEQVIQIDLANRGINSRADLTMCNYVAGDLQRAAVEIIRLVKGDYIGIVTGFYIAAANPPAPESDGILGAVALARGLKKSGFNVLIITDSFSEAAIRQALNFYDDFADIELFVFPNGAVAENCGSDFFGKYSRLKHLIAIERAGPAYPNHDGSDLPEKSRSAESDEVCTDFPVYNMNGNLISPWNAKIHLLFEYIARERISIKTTGIGDGGNEIGMGKIPRAIIHRNIGNNSGRKIACRIATDYLIVAGVSNWGAYALCAAIALLSNKEIFLDKISEQTETELMSFLTSQQVVVDGVTGEPTMSVDGIPWDVHISLLKLLRYIVKTG